MSIFCSNEVKLSNYNYYGNQIREIRSNKIIIDCNYASTNQEEINNLVSLINANPFIQRIKIIWHDIMKMKVLEKLSNAILKIFGEDRRCDKLTVVLSVFKPYPQLEMQQNLKRIFSIPTSKLSLQVKFRKEFLCFESFFQLLSLPTQRITSFQISLEQTGQIKPLNVSFLFSYLEELFRQHQLTRFGLKIKINQIFYQNFLSFGTLLSMQSNLEDIEIDISDVLNHQNLLNLLDIPLFTNKPFLQLDNKIQQNHIQQEDHQIEDLDTHLLNNKQSALKISFSDLSGYTTQKNSLSVDGIDNRSDNTFESINKLQKCSSMQSGLYGLSSQLKQQQNECCRLSSLNTSIQLNLQKRCSDDDDQYKIEFHKHESEIKDQYTSLQSTLDSYNDLNQFDLVGINEDENDIGRLSLLNFKSHTYNPITSIDQHQLLHKQNNSDLNKQQNNLKQEQNQTNSLSILYKINQMEGKQSISQNNNNSNNNTVREQNNLEREQIDQNGQRRQNRQVREYFDSERSSYSENQIQSKCDSLQSENIMYPIQLLKNKSILNETSNYLSAIHDVVNEKQQLNTLRLGNTGKTNSRVLYKDIFFNVQSLVLKDLEFDMVELLTNLFTLQTLKIKNTCQIQITKHFSNQALPQLKQLEINQENLSQKQSAKLCQSISELKNITKLKFHNINNCEDLIKISSNLKKLEELNLRIELKKGENQSKHLKQVYQNLNKNCSLKSIKFEISDNNFDFWLFFKFIKHQQSLEVIELDFFQNKQYTSQISNLCQSLCSNKLLSQLNIKLNAFTFQHPQIYLFIQTLNQHLPYLTQIDLAIQKAPFFQQNYLHSTLVNIQCFEIYVSPFMLCNPKQILWDLFIDL